MTKRRKSDPTKHIIESVASAIDEFSEGESLIVLLHYSTSILYRKCSQTRQQVLNKLGRRLRAVLRLGRGLSKRWVYERSDEMWPQSATN